MKHSDLYKKIRDCPLLWFLIQQLFQQNMRFQIAVIVAIQVILFAISRHTSCYKHIRRDCTNSDSQTDA